MNQARFCAPVSTSNLGPGFDTLGLALGLRLEAVARLEGEGLSIEVEHHGPDKWGPLLGGLVEDLGGTFADRLHQPYRAKLLPFLPDAIEAAEEAGAYGAFLSGAGSTVLAITGRERAETVARQMLAALNSNNEEGETMILEADNRGLIKH